MTGGPNFRTRLSCTTSQTTRYPPKVRVSVTDQLELFAYLPRKPYCTDDLEDGLRIRTASRAIRHRYIQVNPPWLRAWIVMDIDRSHGAIAWEFAELPPPAWSSMNPQNGHAHLAWGISAPVLLGDHDRQQPMRYLAAVESAMTAKLEADPAYSGLITKNPTHSHWRNAWAPPGAGVYELDYLSEFLNLSKHVRAKAPEQCGVGRNVEAFDYLRHRAYREVRAWKEAKGRGAFIYWQKHLYERVLDYTGMEHSKPLDPRECHHIAKSVARWVWRHFDIDASDARFSARQAYRGKKSGESRRQATDYKRSTAHVMAAEGASTRQIAAALDIHQSTVARWLKG